MGTHKWLEKWLEFVNDRLYDRHSTEERHPLSDSCCVVLLILLGLAITGLVVNSQLKDFPNVTVVHHTNDLESERRLGFTCGCNLPVNLQGLEEYETKKNNLNVCYDQGRMETVTVLMYSNTTAGKLDPVVEQYGPKDQLRGNRLVESGGYNVTQRALDLSYHYDNIAEQLPELFLGGYQDLDARPRVDYLLGPNFLTFPVSYARLAFTYDCDNCSSCGLELVNEIFSQESLTARKSGDLATIGGN